MTDTSTKPVLVSSSTPVKDPVFATLRYIVVIVAAVPTIMAFLQNKDIVGLLDFMRSTQGAPIVTAAVALGTAAYGIWKTRKRGVQVTSVAASEEVPAHVADLK